MNNRLYTLALIKAYWERKKKPGEKPLLYECAETCWVYVHIHTGTTCTLLHCFLKKSHLNSWKMSISYRELEFPYFLFSFIGNLAMLVIDWIILYLRMIYTIIKLFTLCYSMMNFNILKLLFRLCFCFGSND